MRDKNSLDTVQFQVTALYVPGANPLAKDRPADTKVAEAKGGAR